MWKETAEERDGRGRDRRGKRWGRRRIDSLHRLLRKMSILQPLSIHKYTNRDSTGPDCAFETGFIDGLLRRL